MALFNIHCVSRVKKGGGSYQALEGAFMFNALESLFMEVCGFPGSGFDDAAVYWWADRPVHQAMHEPFIWLLESDADSIIKKVLKVTPPKNKAGFTAWDYSRGGTISELYLNHPANGTSLSQAKMAFHELMHNKLQAKNDQLHGSDYGFGLNREILDFTTAISATLDSENIKRMAGALRTAVPQ